MITILDQKDRDLRQLWFWVTAVFFVIDPVLLYGFIANLFYPSSNLFSTGSNYSDFFGFQAMFIFQMISKVIWIFCLLHCAYKNPGTKLLSFVLFSAYLCIPFSVIFLFSAAFGLIKPEYNMFSRMPFEQFGLLLYGLQLAFYTWWAYLTIQYRRLNKKIQAQNHPEYLQRLLILGKAKSRESLDEQFSALKKDWPKFKLLTRHEYKLRKAQL